MQSNKQKFAFSAKLYYLRSRKSTNNRTGMATHDTRPVIELTSLDVPEARPFASLTEAQLRAGMERDEGIFIAESPKVIRVALDAGLEPVGLLCERRHLAGDAADIVGRLDGVPVYTGSRELLSALTGYTLSRGVLCAMHRPQARSVREVVEGAHRICIIDGVCDTTNIGAIFRSAAALGIDGVLLTPDSCDPLNRRAVRVSMGSVFLVPWATTDGATDDVLHSLGFKTVAMALTDNSVPIDHPSLGAESRLAIIVGTEGDGLRREVIQRADYVARIPMSHGVDSLNVAAASAVAFWQLRRRLPL